MARTPLKVKLESDTDLVAVVQQIESDRTPRVLERDGKEIAVILSPEDYADLSGEPKSKRNKERLLALAGVWGDMDADELIGRIYRARHESPQTPPVNL